MSKQLDHKIIDEMHTRFRMKICELASLQADKLPLKGSTQEVTVDHQAIATETGISLQNGASYYIVQFVRGQGYWDIDCIIAYE